MVLVLAAILTSIYAIVFSIFIFCLLRLRNRHRSDQEPSVSIIVAARNEEKVIHRCLDSLSKVEYPKQKLEIILVDDQSSDRTFEIMQSYAEKQAHFKVVRITKQIDHLKGKANAIAQGVDHSRGELIFLTDADCVVPISWVRKTVAQHDERTGLVAGYTLLESENWFGGMQSLDWTFLHTLAAAGVGLRWPLSCFGNNLTFRRTAYNEVGGFRKIPFSVTEDFALFTAISRRTEWDYHYLILADTLVMSEPCTTIKELFLQKQRWAIGGLEMKLKGFLLLGLGWLLNALLLAILFLNIPLSFTLSLWALKLIIDGVLLSIPLKRLRKFSLLKFFPAFELYYYAYVLTIPFIVLFSQKVVWKGREF